MVNFPKDGWVKRPVIGVKDYADLRQRIRQTDTLENEGMHNTQTLGVALAHTLEIQPIGLVDTL